MRNINVAMQQYTEQINTLLPDAKIFKLIGFTNGNADYSKAKAPAIKSWQTAKSIKDESIDKWLSYGGWIGTRIPKGRIVIDVDNSNEGELLKELLESENVHHHAICTPNGWQFIFKCESEATKRIKQINKYVSRLGITIDTRTSEKGYIVFPSENTENRFIVTQSLENLDEMPQYLTPVWNGAKTPSPMAYPYEGSGSRNGDFYDLARRLFTCGVSKEDVEESLELAYEYFVLDKEGFTLQEVKSSINSASSKAGTSNNSPSLEDEFQLGLEESNHNANTQVIPKPFTVLNGSLYSIKELKDDVKKIFVSRHVPILTKEFHNIERPQVLYEMRWRQDSKVVSEVVPASTISIRKELLELSERGLSVNENNVKNLINFMDYYLLDNQIEKHYAVERLGKIKDSFIHPLITEGVEVIALDQGEKQLQEGFEVNGTTETWKQEVFERIKHSPKAVFFVLSSFASVLIKDLRITPFIVDLSGTTSQGKTTTLKAAVSVWGNENLMNEWNATKVSIERKASYLNSFPLMLDDTRKADERTLKDIVYQFSGGRSKGRATIKGSQREPVWNNILLSTGEVSLNDYVKQQGGAAARIIPLIDEPLKKDHDNISQLHEAIEDNYGAVGIDFLKVWLKSKKELIAEFLNFKRHYIKKSKGNEVLTRLASYYAAVHFTGSILQKELSLDVDLGAISNLFDEIAEENKAVDKPMQFFEKILIDLDSKRESIFYQFNPLNREIKAFYKARQKQLYLMPAYTSEFLGVEEKQIRREWLKRGMTIPVEKDGKNIDYKLVSHKGKKFNGIALNMDVVNELGFDFEEINDDFSDD